MKSSRRPNLKPRRRVKSKTVRAKPRAAQASKKALRRKRLKSVKKQKTVRRLAGKTKTSRRKARRKRRLPVPFLPPNPMLQPEPQPEPGPPPAAPEPPAPEPEVELADGINLIGHIRAEKGLGESCRAMARSLDTTGIPFSIINYDDGNSRVNDLSWLHRETTEAPYRINLFNMNGDSLIYARPHLGLELFRRRYSIGYWAWELPDFPDSICESFQYLNEVWVPTTFVLDSVSKKSPIPVLRIPHAIQLSPVPWLTRQSFGLPEKPFLFLSMFDTHSIQARKNPEGAIRAFKLAFRPDDPSVGLVIKVNNPHSFTEHTERLRELTEGYPQIYLIEETMERGKVNALIQAADAFVSLHRSEGFGLVMAEAMYFGKPVIATYWSGNTDFMNPSNSCPVEYSFVPVGENWGPYEAYQIWAEPSIEHAAYYMRKLVEDSSWRKRISEAGQHTILTEYSPQAVGELVRRRMACQHLL